MNDVPTDERIAAVALTRGPRRGRTTTRAYCDASTAIVIEGVEALPSPALTAAAALAGALYGVTRTLEEDSADAVTLVAESILGVRQLMARTGAATITAAQLSFDQHPALHLAWLGDNPAYLLRGGSLQQLTRPHTAAQALAEAGRIDFSSVSGHPFAGEITNSIGIGSEDPETLSIPLVAGDRILIGSRQVGLLQPAAIGKLLGTGTADEAARSLLEEFARVARNAGATVAVILVSSDFEDGSKLSTDLFGEQRQLEIPYRPTGAETVALADVVSVPDWGSA